MKPVSDLRVLYGWEISPTGTGAGRYLATDDKDRQIIADAVAAEARFIVTENVDDFGEGDLAATGLSAVNPDLFMKHRLPRDSYLAALGTLIHNRHRPPNALPDMHMAIAKNHPLLFEAHANLFPVTPAQSHHNPPRELFRGVRCLRCGKTLSSATSLNAGLGPDCRLLV
jgi:hypothetical protein